MSTVNGVPFRQWLVPSSKYNIKAPYTMIPKKITLHNTDNQMPAVNEISYMRNNNNQTSYHLAIDEKEAIQGLPYNRNGWHSGDGGNGYGNRNTVGVEICRNYDRSRKTTNLNDPLKSQYSKAELNTIKFVAQLCIDLGIVANNDNIKTHNDWNGKWCPSKILNENRLQLVKNAVIVEYNRLKGNNVKPSKPVKPSTNKPKPTPATPKPTPQPVTGKQTLHLPASAKTWRVYKPNGPYTVGNEVHLLTPSAFGGIDYEIKGNPAKDVYLIDTGVKGRVAIYAGAETGAKITNNKAPVTKPTPKAKRLYLPASAKLWKIYHPKGPYTSGSEIHNLTPSAYGGLDYEIKGNPAPHVYLIDTGVKGRVAIYAHPSTGAVIK